jgi:type II secretory pathway component PulM
VNEFEQRQEAEEPLRAFDAEFPGRRRRRLLMGAASAFLVVVLVVWGALFVGMNNKIHQLDRTTAAQSAQIKSLSTQLTTVNASLGAAVACLQTVGALEGLCSKLVK